MKTVAAELAQLVALATRLNRLAGVSRRNPEAWHVARDDIARSIARSVGIIRKELGIVDADDTARAFRARLRDTGIVMVRLPGRRGIPVERRPARISRCRPR